MSFDMVFVGGGLSSCLAATRVGRKAPSLRICIVEQTRALGGRHTWCFHGSDVVPGYTDDHWLRPFVTHSWSCQDVSFPKLRRRLAQSYHMMRSHQLHEVMMREFQGTILLHRRATAVDGTSVALDDGTRLRARHVFDGRGFGTMSGECGFQKFHGVFLQVDSPHGLVAPRIMDATVPQRDGFRFMYVLPHAPSEMLVEDTCYSDHELLDEDASRKAILDYAAAQGWRVTGTTGSESGVLPIPLFSARAFPADQGSAIPIGTRAGLFHPTTGYSVGESVSLADLIADNAEAEDLAVRVERHARARWADGAYLRRLNSVLFRVAVPRLRYVILQQFYSRQDSLISRFYGNRLTRLDKVILMSGRPPVPVFAALKFFSCGAPAI